MGARLRLVVASYPPDGGAARQAAEVVAGLDPARWEVAAACPAGSELWRTLEALGHVALHPLAPGKEPARSDLRDLGLLRSLLRGADLAHAHASKAGFLVRLAARTLRRRARVVYTPHAWSFWVDAARAGRWTRLERAAARWCDAIVAVAEAERTAGLDRGVGSPGAYRVIRNGVHANG